jgi:N6-L-threonylcarbamoyladenine synthase
MYILSIDTSCDDTSAAIIENDCVLSNAISSQIELHKKYGGVVPIIANRAHKERIDPIINEALSKAHISIEQIDVFAVTFGPGLAIALEVGIKKAKELALQYDKPLIAVNHLEGHIYANFAKNSHGNLLSNKMEFPILVVLVSGGHTELVLMKNHGEFQLIGETLDDACGEAFDKVARLLQLGYPGGPIIEKLAEQGDPTKHSLPIPMERSGDLNMSYSGLKTAALHLVKEIEGVTSLGESMKSTSSLSSQDIKDVAASFQYSAFKQLTVKIEKAVKQFSPNSILLGGGVVANKFFRKEVRAICRKYNIIYSAPAKRMSMDNAAMIGVAAYFRAQQSDFVKDIEALDRNPVLNFSK